MDALLSQPPLVLDVNAITINFKGTDIAP